MSKARKPQSRNPAQAGARTAGAGSRGAVRLTDPRSSDGSSDGSPDGADVAPAATGAARTAAVGLWVLVSGGLVYGVVQTVLKAVQLFA